MPATEKKPLDIHSLKKLGILAGSGMLPKKLAAHCDKMGIEPFIIAFEGQTPKDMVDGYKHVWCNLGAAGKIIKSLKAHNVQDIVMIGAIKRPAFSELKPDMKGAEIIARIGMKAFGDNDLLELLRSEFQREGLSVHGVHNFLQDLLAPVGLLGKIKPSTKMKASIKHGVHIAYEIGKLDIGQSVIVQQGIIIGVEGAEGTDALITRCKAYFKKGEKPILIKMQKPQQDKALDLPTIGPDTVVKASEAGLAGIVIKAGGAILTDIETMRDIANENKLFILGIEDGEYN